jgi:hypothetical protein
MPIIVLTDHVRDEVFPERIGCSPKKYLKLAEKAWRSTEPIGKGEITNPAWHEAKNGPLEYRKLMGLIYVFGYDRQGRDRIALVTIYPPGKNAREPRPNFAPH